MKILIFCLISFYFSALHLNLVVNGWDEVGQDFKFKFFLAEEKAKKEICWESFRSDLRTTTYCRCGWSGGLSNNILGSKLVLITNWYKCNIDNMDVRRGSIILVSWDESKLGICSNLTKSEMVNLIHLCLVDFNYYGSDSTFWSSHFGSHLFRSEKVFFFFL